jgi:hypothetical protein
MYKINWDAALDVKSRRMGIGIIARDFKRQVIAARGQTICITLDPVVAEAHAALNAA